MSGSGSPRSRRLAAFALVLAPLTWQPAGAARPAPPVEPLEAPGRILLDAGGTPLPFGSDDEVVDFLANAEVVAIEEVALSTRTRPSKLLLEREGIRTHAIFHDLDQYEERVALGDRVVRDFRDSYRNQVAAYQLSRLLGMDNVPPAVERRIDGRPGAVTLWIEETATWTNWRLNRGGDPRQVSSTPEVWALRRQDFEVFDALIDNLDRHDSNILVDSRSKLWLIDHTRAFGRQRHLTEPKAIDGCSRPLWQRLEMLDVDQLRLALSPHLGAPELKALERRHRALLRLLNRLIRKHGEQEVLFEPPWIVP